MHDSSVKTNRALISIELGGATASFGTCLFSLDCFVSEIGVALHMFEFISCNYNISGEINNLSTHQSRVISVWWWWDKHCVMIVLRRIIQEQDSLVDCNNAELLSKTFSRFLC